MASLALSPISPSEFCVRVHPGRYVSSCHRGQQPFGLAVSSARKSRLVWRNWRTERAENETSGFVSSKSSRSEKSTLLAGSNFAGGVTSSQSEVAVDNECQPAPKPLKEYIVREAKLDEELWAAAWIRAESYCEEQPYVRYIESYKKRFAEQEFDALKRRLLGKYGQSIKCICLVAVSGRPTPSTLNGTQSATILERVVGTLDLSVRHISQGEAFQGDSIRATLLVGALDVRGSHRYGYIANVCVTKAARRSGIGSSLLGTAIEASKNWGLKELYVHVNSTNKAAQRLYNKYNFKKKQAAPVQVGVQNVILLQLLL